MSDVAASAGAPAAAGAAAGGAAAPAAGAGAGAGSDSEYIVPAGAQTYPKDKTGLSIQHRDIDAKTLTPLTPEVGGCVAVWLWNGCGMGVEWVVRKLRRVKGAGER